MVFLVIQEVTTTPTVSTTTATDNRTSVLPTNASTSAETTKSSATTSETTGSLGYSNGTSKSESCTNVLWIQLENCKETQQNKKNWLRFYNSIKQLVVSFSK